MYDFKTVVLGIAPTRRDFFPDPAAAEAHSEVMMRRILEICQGIHDLKIVTLDGVLDKGLLVETADVPKAAEHFMANKIDALFLPHANFGMEEACGKLAWLLKVPVLLWGPRDGDPHDGKTIRLYDTQCGLFATSRALLRYGVPFTYVENCWLDSPVLEKGIEDFVRTAAVVKAFRNMRILTLANRPRQFLSVKVNEGELMERFAMEVTAVNSYEWEEEINRCLVEEQEAICDLIRQWRGRVAFSGYTEQYLTEMAAAELAILNLAEKYDCRAVASECWDTLIHKRGFRPCFMHADLTEKGLSVCCECDVLGAATSVICQAVTRGEIPPFFADITVRHPFNDNAELLWHCGPFPPSLARDEKPEVFDSACAFELKRGEMTIVRFDGDHGTYRLFADCAEGIDGPKSFGSYVWVETKDWPAWERKLMYGPYIHHCAGIYGNYKKVLQEAARYLDVVFDCVD